MCMFSIGSMSGITFGVTANLFGAATLTVVRTHARDFANNDICVSCRLSRNTHTRSKGDMTFRPFNRASARILHMLNEIHIVKFNACYVAVCVRATKCATSCAHALVAYVSSSQHIAKFTCDALARAHAKLSVRVQRAAAPSRPSSSCSRDWTSA